MITESTVLILGAGASNFCDLPTGKELFDHICSGFRILNTPRVYEVMTSCGFYPGDTQNFAKELKYSGLCSVDQFLECQPEWINYGKHAIAASLLPLERMEPLFIDSHDKPNWYKVLYNRLNSPFERFAENKLSVITYNYDRSLEQFLFTSLKNTYGKSDEVCAAVIDRIPIIHLHGSFAPIFGQPGKVVAYESDATPAQVKFCASNIRIIHEPVDKDPVFSQAHAALKSAQIIAFLGFGFNNTNIERLLPEGMMRGYRPSVFASVYGFGVAERMAIEARLRKCFPSSEVFIGQSGHSINDMLHDYPIMPIL